MRITIVYRYFLPDTPPYASMLKSIASWLVDEGHSVRVITAQPAYKPEAKIPRQPSYEVIDGIEVFRLPLMKEKGKSWRKLINSGFFISLSALQILFGRKTDLVWTATMPPVLQALTIMIAGKVRGAEMLYHMQDIHPEISVASNLMKPGLVTRAMRYLDRYTLRKARQVVLLSEDMREAIVSRGIAAEKVRVVRNFSLGIEGRKDRVVATSPKNSERIRFVFAGNIGRFQNLEALVEAFAKLPKNEVELIFVGDGKAKEALKKKARECDASHVVFYDHMSSEAVFDLMCECHVGVISLLPNLYKYAFPSKLLTYMAANLPVLALIEDESALAKLLRDNTIGVSIPWDRTDEELVQAILSAASLARTGNANPVEMTDYYQPQSARKHCCS